MPHGESHYDISSTKVYREISANFSCNISMKNVEKLWIHSIPQLFIIYLNVAKSKVSELANCDFGEMHF